MESTGPTTRSRARGGAPPQTSAAPSTRRKPATRSTRKSSVPPPELVAAKDAPAVQENDDTIIQADHAEAEKSNSHGTMTAEADVPPTMAAPGTAPIAGLTPVNATPGYTMTTPATMGPSPVMPIKLDSLWSPEVPQHSNSTDLAAPATTATHSRPSEAGIDLAAMFISTPAPPTAAGDAATSPIEGLVSAEPSSAAVDPNSSSEPFAEQPFGGFAEAAMAGSPAAADLDQQVVNEQTAAEQEQHDVDSDSEPVSSGSPAAVAMEDATVTEMDDFQPSAPPMSLSHNPTPVKSSRAPAARSSAPPAAAARSTPGRTPGRATLSPAPAGTPASPYPESDDDMPEAEAEYPEEKALLAEALAGGLVMSDSAQQHAEETTAPTADKHAAAAPVEPAAAVDEMLPYAEVETAQQQEYEAHQEQPEELAAAGAEQEQYSEEDLLHDLPTTEDAEDPMEDTEVTPAAAQTADQGTAAAQLEDEQLMADSQAEAAVDGDIDTYTAAGTEAAADEQDTAMEVCDNPAATAAEATPVKESAPAQDADAAMSPEVMSLAFEDAAAAGSRFTSSQATTAAPPKSAMAKPKDAATADKKAAGRKSAHVVLPNPSPVKSSSKPVTGRHSMPGSSSGAGNDTSSSPGHTPFPTKSKVRAATAAAECAAAAKDVTLKKEIAYARAHSALKHYSSKPEQQTDEEMGSPAAAPASASKKSSSGGSRSTTVTSRLLQPTASSMAKYRTSLTSEVDTHVWSPPEAEASAAAPAAAGSIKPRLASKVVVPSPVQKQKAEPSIKALKRAIKDKAEKKAKATVAEHKSSSDTQKVHDVHAMRGSKKSLKAAKAAPAAELDFDEEDYDEGYDQDYHTAADELADTMTGLSMGPIRVHKPAGPLKGVAAPTGKHFVFDDAGEAKETPSSKLRAAPKHTYFDEEGNPKSTPPLPRWR